MKAAAAATDVAELVFQLLPEGKIAGLIADLPDANSARSFLARLADSPKVAETLRRDEGLLADALALAAWSPLLGTTLVQNPSYVTWLARERAAPRVRTHEELMESLGRFALTNSQLDAQTLLARFRRRELLRIYLKDIRRTATVVELTEELSNLADAVLRYALRLATQEMDNLYGPPLCVDERGRAGAAQFCVIGLGKLGSYELNYASDIDLQFIFSADGTTAGTGERGPLTNREYYGKLAGAVARLAGQAGAEAAAYRVDLRLRPHGRDGALATSLAEAVRYYRATAHPWELQTLIRARAAAGDAPLYVRFAEAVRDRVYRRDETTARALAHVRLAKRKIDRHHEQGRGYNVKLGRGGIREIEFIAQALQLAYGARDVWLQVPHTLISLGRLADRAIISEREYTNLSEAYVFLRTLEHRLQMEEGLQTHLLPEEPARRELVARRMHFAGADPLADFERDLRTHTERVHAAFTRVFGDAPEMPRPAAPVSAVRPSVGTGEPREPKPSAAPSVNAADAATKAARDAAALLLPHLRSATDPAALETFFREAAAKSLNAQRALVGTERVASSLAKLPAPPALAAEQLRALVELCGASEYFTEMIASNPVLIEAIPPAEPAAQPQPAATFAPTLREAVLGEENLGAEMAALRRVWANLLIEIGARDARGQITIAESTARQSALAAASIDAACLIARREMARRLEASEAALGGLRFAVLGLGRLGGNGLDYGSDLDLILIYDDDREIELGQLTRAELMARYTELFVAALSSVTREGQLYRVDLRLRPDGKNGATSSPARAFTEYAKERAAVWEWLAYVKLRAVGGDLELGRAVEAQARAAIHERAAREASAAELTSETRRVRERLERERRRGGAALDIKYGPGGMLDVYFAVRLLQLRNDVPDREPNRSTAFALGELLRRGSLAERDYSALSEGYALLRKVDHHVRLIVGRSSRLHNADYPALRDIARRAGYESSAALLGELQTRMREIRAAYQRLTGAQE